MDYYKDENGAIFGYSTDTPKEKMRNGLTPLSDAELVALKLQQMSMQDLGAKMTANVNAEYESRAALAVVDYPVHERESWAIQQQEAALLLDAEEGQEVETVWIDSAARSRDIGRLNMAEKISKKDKDYRRISGHLSGVRQRHVERIALYVEGGEDYRQPLQNYDWTKYWDDEKPDYSDGGASGVDDGTLTPGGLTQEDGKAE